MLKKPVKVGDVITIDLDSLANGGDVVGRKDGFAIFVSQGIPGEKVKIKITQVKKNYGRGEIIEVIEKSEERINPTCKESDLCGGCQISHIDYGAQLKYKKIIVKDALERIAKLKDIKVNFPLGMEHPFAYRNKAQFPLGVEDNKVITGFFAPGTHKIVDIRDCEIQHPLINRIVKRTIELIEEYKLSIYDEKIEQGLLRHLVVRIGVCTNQAMLIFVTKDNKFPEAREIARKLMEEIPELVSVNQNINPKKTNVVLGKITKNLVGEEYIIDYLGGVKYKISPQSFFQVNTLEAKVLYDQILKYADLSGEETIMDFYCGLGSITLYLARCAKKVYGIEVVKEAIAMAKENARLNEIDNCSFEAGKVREVLPKLKNVKPDIIVLDPPRKGCHENVLKEMAKLDPKKIIYVSCNPSSLARDLRRLKEYGYQTKEIQPVDMFPQTYHIENVAVLKAVES